MPEVEVQIGGRSYRLGCGEGEEAHLRALARRLDGVAEKMIASMGQLTEGRLMLMCALMMADQLHEAEGRASEAETAPKPDPARESELAGQLHALAGRLETLVGRLAPEGRDA